MHLSISIFLQLFYFSTFLYLYHTVFLSLDLPLSQAFVYLFILLSLWICRNLYIYLSIYLYIFLSLLWLIFLLFICFSISVINLACSTLNKRKNNKEGYEHCIVMKVTKQKREGEGEGVRERVRERERGGILISGRGRWEEKKKPKPRNLQKIILFSCIINCPTKKEPFSRIVFVQKKNFITTLTKKLIKC